MKVVDRLLILAVALTAASKPAAAQTIPLCPGLTIVTAVSQANGDYESIKTIESVAPAEGQFKYSSEAPPGLLDPDMVRTTVRRRMLGADLQSAHAYQQVFLDKSDETIPGTTSLGASAAMLRELKTKGETEFQISNAYGELTLSADRSKFPSYYNYLQQVKLKRVGTAPVTVRVLVNDRLVELPTIRGDGESVGDKVQFLFLDDERNPLALSFRLGIDGIKPLIPVQRQLCEKLRSIPNAPIKSAPGMRCDMPNGGDRDVLRVIKITYRCAAPAGLPAGGAGAGAGGLAGGDAGVVGGLGAGAIEQALANSGKVDVYSIYFSFNSDVIREESEPALRDIADVLRRHPAWRLALNGHTDAIGGDQANLDLSKRRSAAVKDALVKRYAIDPNRLATSGVGKTQPKDTNDTLEGRSHNRRVELVKVG